VKSVNRKLEKLFGAVRERELSAVDCCIDVAVALLLTVAVLRNVEQGRQTTYNTTLRCVRVTIVAV
jgi:hypothetical protein